MPTLSDKLKSLGVQVGARDLAPQKPRRAYTVESIMPGRVHPTAFGEAFLIEKSYPPEYRHGHAALQITASLETIAAWARQEQIAGCAANGMVFLDTETTGLAGGTGTYAFLVGIGRYLGDSFQLTQFFMRDPIEEPAMLAALIDLLQPLDALVTFNGKAFDVPLLNARYITNRCETPFADIPHLDLLPLARRLWRNRLESRALGSLETHILGAARSGQDIPGFLIPQMYFDYLQTGDARPLERVLYHNAMDVVAMAALLSHVAALLDNPLVFAVEHGLDLIAIGKLFEDLGRLDEAAQLYARGLELDVPEEAYRQTVRRLALLHRQRGDMPTALDLWKGAAGTRQMYAFVELAKYYEHKERDYAQAEEWTRAGLAILRDRATSPTVRREWLADLEHRLERLELRQRKK
ncbi:MAG: ribonuclease H-like domain-containing protein [Chloroflexi bacterium]|nr:ribonuclease H-like domain-containing protein [Chloroflexota bacterium]